MSQYGLLSITHARPVFAQPVTAIASKTSDASFFILPLQSFCEVTAYLPARPSQASRTRSEAFFRPRTMRGSRNAANVSLWPSYALGGPLPSFLDPDRSTLVPIDRQPASANRGKAI